MNTTDSNKSQQTEADTLQNALEEISNQAASAGVAVDLDDALDMLQNCGRIADEALEAIKGDKPLDVHQVAAKIEEALPGVKATVATLSKQ